MRYRSQKYDDSKGPTRSVVVFTATSEEQLDLLAKAIEKHIFWLDTTQMTPEEEMLKEGMLNFLCDMGIDKNLLLTGYEI